MNRLITDALSDVVDASLAEIEKKQARTLREQLEAMDHDSADDVLEEEAKDDEQEEEQVKQQANRDKSSAHCVWGARAGLREADPQLSCGLGR